jgi:toxin ParE1/3/4
MIDLLQKLHLLTSATEFHQAALQEYAEAMEFFAQQNKQQDFIDTIESIIFQIIGAPQRWPIVEARFAII